MGYMNWRLTCATTVILWMVSMGLSRSETFCKDIINEKIKTDGMTRNEIKTRPTSHSDFTILPADRDCDLKVTNSGPAVIFSNVHFNATLRCNGHQTNPDEYLYVWKNSADFSELRKEDDSTSDITKKFMPKDLTTKKEFWMEVCVYRKQQIVLPNFIKEHHKRISYSNTTFILTVMLNGKLSAYQEFENKTEPKAIATHEPVVFTLEITDQFNQNNGSKLAYIWKKNSETFVSDTPVFNITFSKAEKDVEVSAIATLPVVHVSFQEFIMIDTLIGLWKYSFQVQDVMKNVRISGSSFINYKEKKNFTVNYSGSNPATVCWSLCSNTTNNCDLEACSEPITGEDKVFHILLHMRQPGLYTLKTTVKNAISESSSFKQFTVQKEKHNSSYVIPVIFSCIGFIILICGLAVIFIRKKKHVVEEADFDFHPHIQSSPSAPLMSSLKRKMSDVMSRGLKKPNLRSNTSSNINYSYLSNSSSVNSLHSLNTL